MSRFQQVRDEAREAARRRARPSALQVAWLTVLLLVGGTILWLAVTAPAESQADGVQAAAAPEAILPAPEPAPAPKAEEAARPSPAPEAPAPAASVSPMQPQLTPAPIPELVEDSAVGPLPRIGPGGREPWRAYARPFAEASTRPRIAVVISNLGLRKSTTEAAIATLPPAVTLAFSPYGGDLAERSAAARAAGHELMLLVPMEPEDYPRNDPGPHTLLVEKTAADNLDRLHWVMARFTGYVGVMNDMGSRFTASEAAMAPILREVKARGLLFMDARASQYSVAAELARSLRVPRAVNNRYIDNQQSDQAIRQRLEELEAVAEAYGAAAGIGRPYPVTLKTVSDWATGLDARGFDLVPLSAIANRQPVR